MSVADNLGVGAENRTRRARSSGRGLLLLGTWVPDRGRRSDDQRRVDEVIELGSACTRCARRRPDRCPPGRCGWWSSAARSATTRRCCCSTSRRAGSTAARPAACSGCCATWRRAASGSCWWSTTWTWSSTSRTASIAMAEGRLHRSGSPDEVRVTRTCSRPSTSTRRSLVSSSAARRPGGLRRGRGAARRRPRRPAGASPRWSGRTVRARRRCWPRSRAWSAPGRWTVRWAGHEMSHRTPPPAGRARAGMLLVPERRGIFTDAVRRRTTWRSSPHAARRLGRGRRRVPRARASGSASAPAASPAASSRCSRCPVPWCGSPGCCCSTRSRSGSRPQVTRRLFTVVAELARTDATVVLVDQYLSEVLRLADVVYVLVSRRGRLRRRARRARGSGTPRLRRAAWPTRQAL